MSGKSGVHCRSDPDRQTSRERPHARPSRGEDIRVKAYRIALCTARPQQIAAASCELAAARQTAEPRPRPGPRHSPEAAPVAPTVHRCGTGGSRRARSGAPSGCAASARRGLPHGRKIYPFTRRTLRLRPPHCVERHSTDTSSSTLSGCAQIISDPWAHRSSEVVKRTSLIGRPCWPGLSLSDFSSFRLASACATST